MSIKRSVARLSSGGARIEGAGTMTTHSVSRDQSIVGTTAGVDDQAMSFVPRPSFYRSIGKRMFDFAFVLALVPVVLPLMATIFLILLLQGASPLYVQERVGLGGRKFRIWKFRTMIQDADAVLEEVLAANPAMRAEWNATQKLKNDPRITPFGSLLRKTSLDELPQLWNVLIGQMSLLGPRPMMPEQTYLYGPALPVYTSLRPGISGVWQVSDRNESHFQRRAELDIDYARDLSFATDLHLVLKTLRTMLRSTGY